MNKIQAILLDIDNTLILYNEKEVFKKIILSIYKYFTPFFTYNDFVQRFDFALKDLSNCNGKKLNKSYFLSSLLKGTSYSADKIWNLLLLFFESDYKKFRDVITPVNGANEVFNKIKQLNYKIVIASQPALPKPSNW